MHSKLSFIMLLISLIFADLILIYSNFCNNTLPKYLSQYQNYSRNNSYSFPLNVQNCNNGLKYFILDYYIYQMSLIKHTRSSRVQLIFEVYFKSSSYSKFSVNLETTIHNISIYSLTFSSFSIQQQNTICYTGDPSINWDMKTIVSNVVNTPNSTYLYSYFILSTQSMTQINLRNIFMFAEICHPSCIACNGPNKNQCLYCYQGSLISGQCFCSGSTSFIQPDVGCVLECYNDYYIANDQRICIIDRRIISKFKYFQFTTQPKSIPPHILIPTIYNSQYVQTIKVTSYEYYGDFRFNQGMHLQIPHINGLKFIRIRLTLVINSFVIGSQINIFIDNQLKCQVRAISSNVSVIDATLIWCYSNPCYTVRIEKIVQTTRNSPLLTLQGKLSQNSIESWGFSNITIDAGLCQENCKICSNFDDCQECETGYIIYQKKCVSKCPVYSSNCIDYADLIPYSRYLAKGFYDMNMTYDQILMFFDSVTNPTTNFKTGQKFSFFPQKFVLGGLMVWNDATYIKSWVISKPHYAVTIRFNLTFGDEYTGNFYYKINTEQSGAFQIPSSGGQNLIGNDKEERIQHFHIYKDPFKTSPLNIELQCTQSSLDILQEFCAISEYFIVVHYCPPFCSDCSSDLICNVWESGYTNSQCASNKFLSFNPTTETYSCQTCSQIGCLACTSLEECVSCQMNGFQLSNGICSCYPSHFLSGTQCFQCNKYCESCDGIQSNNCLTCNSDFYRIISFNICVCQKGYQEDGINLPCVPICGDQLVVNGEDCDDGNNNPFDGCYNCQYQCEEQCIICVKGQCLICQDGYTIIQNKCVLICGDSQIIYPEQCEDNNLTPYDGYFQCKFSCSLYCIECYLGSCLKCDEIKGWYLQEDNTCQTICGDGIIVYPFEQCDDGNEDPFDTCDHCLFSELEQQKNCSFCLKGNCMRCEDGYKLQKRTNTCIVDYKCGDNQIVQPYESCEDDNNMKFDGCYKCQLSCQQSCTNCISEGCLECNVLGWEYNSIEMKCEPVCGDGIILIGIEECDDLISFNCYNCRFQCQESCNVCLKGICLNCKKGWQVNKFDKLCYPVSGDLQIVGNEQCDDFNRNPYDGCYQSQYQCQTVCIICELGKCQQCENGYFIIKDQCKQIQGDGIIVHLEQCEDLNLFAQDGCFQTRFDCPQYCSTCVMGQCLDCNKKSGYGQIDIYRNVCISICGDNILSLDEECDDGNDIAYDGCFNCLFQCQLFCENCINGKCQQCKEGYYLNKKQNQCLSICGDGIVAHDEQCDDGNTIIDDGCSDCRFQCHKKCIACVEGVCQDCRGVGWEINMVTRYCQTICGDGYQIENEQCDDGNDKSEDGCYDCYFECQKSCTQCLRGFCIQCGTLGWDLDYDECIPHCGDKLVVGNEECDDGNQVPFDGCYQCKYQCQEQCTDCQKGVCYKCEIEGWSIANNLCYPVCGDSYIVIGYEQCDDGNDVQYDGCYQCTYQCEQKCTLCEKGICFECNHLGWIIENNKCVPMCGDGIILGDEECDDMNNYYNDGCFQCKNVCDQYCIDCQNGICYLCETGRFLQMNVCRAICGDGYYVVSEELCDDGNDNNGDGCNDKCLVESDFYCFNTEETYSQCFYSKKPIVKINILTKIPEDFQDIEITFDQKVKYSKNMKGDFLNYFSSTIKNLKSSEFSITKSYYKSLDGDGDIKLNFRIYFNVPITDPQFQVTFIDDPIISLYDLPLKESSITFKLITPLVLSSTQKTLAEGASQFNEVVIYSLGSLSILCLATGSQEIFWNLIDQLQYLSYINYINIQFPSNLNIYFEVFQLISIQPLLDLLKFNKLFEIFNYYHEEEIQQDNKFSKTGINPFFLINFTSTLFCFCIGFIAHQITRQLCRFLYLFGPFIISKTNFKIGIQIKKLRDSLKKNTNQFYYNGILRIFMSNSYDFFFAAAIQLVNFSSSNTIGTVSSYLSLLAFVSCFSISFYLIYLIHGLGKISQSSNKIKYDVLFEGIKQKKSSYWILQYNSILLIKKQIFICIIVFMQNEGQLQTICVAINQTLFLCYLITNKPFLNNFEYYKMVCTESILIFNVLTFLIYSNRVPMDLTLQQCINLGWINIFSSTLTLAITLFLDGFQQIKLIYNSSKMRCFEPHIKKQQSSLILFW